MWQRSRLHYRKMLWFDGFVTALEMLGMLFLVGIGMAYPECLPPQKKKEDMRRYGAIVDTPPYLNPPTPRP